MVEDIISKYNSDGVWTSGRLCNFHGCDVSKQGYYIITEVFMLGAALAAQEHQWVVLVRIR